MSFISNIRKNDPYRGDRFSRGEVTVKLDMWDCDYGSLNYCTEITAGYIVDHGYAGTQQEPDCDPSVDIQSIKVVDRFGDVVEPWSKARIQALIWEDSKMMEIIKDDALKAEGVL